MLLPRQDTATDLHRIFLARGAEDSFGPGFLPIASQLRLVLIEPGPLNFCLLVKGICIHVFIFRVSLFSRETTSNSSYKRFLSASSFTTGSNASCDKDKCVIFFQDLRTLP